MNWLLIFGSTYVQVFPSREQLHEQFCNKAHPEPYKCLFKNASVKNVIPDPDLPPQCDPSSAEYGFFENRIISFQCDELSSSVLLVNSLL